MKRYSGLVVLVWVLSGCQQEPSEPSIEQQREDARAQAVKEAEEEEALGPGGYVVTAEKLDAFVRYQRRMIEVYSGLVREAQQLMKRGDGGLAAAQEASRVLEGKALAEEALRKELKLTRTDVRMLSAMATEVASRRSLAQSLRLEDALLELEDAKTRLGEQRKTELDEQLESIREQQASLVQLRDSRAKWGDANVELLLTREAELLKNYQDMLAQFSAPERRRESGTRTAVPSDAGVASPDAG